MDFYDWLTLFFVGLVFTRLYFSEPQHRVVTILSLILCLFFVFESANRILGYPDRKYDALEVLITIIQAGLGFSILFLLKKVPLLNKLLWAGIIAVNIYFPVITIPSTWLRHYLTLHNCDGAITRWRPNAVITKVTSDHIYALQKIRNEDGSTVIKAVSYVWSGKGVPRAETQADLKYGEGSMNNQTPNQPYRFLVDMQAKIKGI